ncbi:MAG TPA: molybdopterin molybdenumtransferase MoeA [Planctomycetes bacterium]|nr:molybdopterin molybdenumtransferase MoeA [Planctomycetota bacterium]
MLTPREALAQILERISPFGAADEESLPLPEACGRILAREAVSDVDLPPFEKSMMDGFALRSADATEPGARLRCVGESRAGAAFDGEVPPGACIEIYTGAALPSELDAVEMVELTSREGDEVRFERPVPAGRHVSHRGEILTDGKGVFTAGHRLRAADLAVLAAVGVDPVPVLRAPVVSILTTGDELVPPSRKPGPSQIREGNTAYLAGACRARGLNVRTAGIVPDEAAALEEAFGAALEGGDALITTGGVSMGKYDLVGACLERLGVEPVLHKVAIKPGKPIWFGMRGEKPVFGLPGNPVSTMLGFEVFVRPALARLGGAPEDEQRMQLLAARWLGPERTASDREHNLPVRVRTGEDGVRELHPLAYRGSADIVGAAAADGLCVIPPGETIRPGQSVTYRPFGAARG